MTSKEIFEFILNEIEESELRIELAQNHSDTKKELEYLYNKKEVLTNLYNDLKSK